MEWLTFAVGAAIGALAIVAPVMIAWRQRVILLRDRTADRERERKREVEREEHEAKIARREKWQPEYEEIRQCLDFGETLAYRVLDRGPCNLTELDALDVAAFVIKSKILAGRGIERLRDPLLGLASLATELQRHAVSDEVALVAVGAHDRPPDGDQRKGVLREAILQDRAAHGLAEEIKVARQILRSEWGD